MNLKLNVVKMSNEDVIATSSYGCSFDGKTSYALQESGGIYSIGAYDDSDITFNFSGQTPKVGAYYHIWPDSGEITLTECDNPNHRAAD